MSGHGSLRLVSSDVKIALPARIRQRARVTQILVIDDDLATGDLIRDVLREEGHDVVFVERLESAIPDLAPDLVITDLVGLHHYDTALARLVLRRVHTRYPDAPIIVCTGHEQAMRESTRLGAAAVLRKPFTLEALVKIVTNAIAR
jgi:DNA-binding NtrC family response regulator